MLGIVFCNHKLRLLTHNGFKSSSEHLGARSEEGDPMTYEYGPVASTDPSTRGRVDDGPGDRFGDGSETRGRNWSVTQAIDIDFGDDVVASVNLGIPPASRELGLTSGG